MPTMSGVLHRLLTESPSVRAVVAAATQVEALDVTAPPSARSLLVGALGTAEPGAGRLVVAVTATAREAEDLVVELGDVLDAADVALYPAWETLPHERLSPRSDTVGQRLAVLRRLAHPDATQSGRGRPRVVVTPIRAVLQPQACGLGDIEPVHVRPGSQVELDDLVRSLADAGYQRVDLVERRGEFTVRGGLVDVFPPGADHPLRVELWGDEVAEIRAFAVADQRSLGTVDEVFAPACRELLLTDEVRGRAARLAEQHPGVAEMLLKVSHGTAVEGMESLAAILLDDMELVLDVLPSDALVLVCDPERVRTRARDLAATDQEFRDASWAAAAEGGTTPVDVGGSSFWSLADVRTHARRRGQAWWSTSPFEPGSVDDGVGADESHMGSSSDPSLGGTADSSVRSMTMGWQPAPGFRGDELAGLAQLRAWLDQRWATVLLAAGHGTLDRAAEVLAEDGLPVRRSDQLSTDPVVHLTVGRLSSGFVDPDAGLAVLTERDLTGRDPAGSRKGSALPSRRRHQVDPLSLQPGDVIVHDQHGVGRYVEMSQRTTGGAVREYLVVEYAPR